MIAFYVALIGLGWASYSCFERPVQAAIRSATKKRWLSAAE
jgi:peptidoglycan/LPS O-acetylase OafA/YrhL